jgi:hypothetical protein
LHRRIAAGETDPMIARGMDITIQGVAKRRARLKAAAELLDDL